VAQVDPLSNGRMSLPHDSDTSTDSAQRRSSTPSVSPPDAPAADIAALLAAVVELERCQQEEDVDGFLALFDPATVWVNGAGARLIGLEAIAVFARQVLPGAMADGSVTYDVEHVAFIRPDVALTGVNQQYVDQAGQPHGGAGRPSYVWSKLDDAWKIVTGQNTAVLPDED